MYAIIETGGRQYRVTPGQMVDIEKIEAAPGDMVTFDRVLLVADGQDVKVGQPLVEGARVHARVLGQHRYRKVTVFRYMPKERIRRKKGHRQPYTLVRIDTIEA